MTVAETAPELSPSSGAQSVPQSGWHWAEWGCEFAGTALLMLGGLSDLFCCFSTKTPFGPNTLDLSTKLLLTGLAFALSGLIVSLSSIGRRSGAHVNPAVSLAFWKRGHMHHTDLVAYAIAQVLGAFAGTYLARRAWRSDLQSL